MITSVSKRLLFLLAFLLLGLSALFLLPKSPKCPPPGILMSHDKTVPDSAQTPVLPQYVGDWYEWRGVDLAISQKERDILGSETRFARKEYASSHGDSIHVSIVLAGEDMGSSIHRPERCLPAQGYNIVDTRSVKLLMKPLPLTTKRLHNLRPVYSSEGKPVNFTDGRQVVEHSLMYYWFVGCSETTHDHTTRYFYDMRDRLLKGYNQPWAYVTVASQITQSIDKRGRTEAQTDAMLQDFIKKLVPAIQLPTVQNR